jgi:DNA-binding IclR family transcriptional regulator
MNRVLAPLVPAKAGTQSRRKILDSRFRGNERGEVRSGKEMPGKKRPTASRKRVSTSYIAPPVQRAVRLLRHIADGDPITSLSETSKALKINRTTLLRLLYTLESEGFVQRRPGDAGYEVGLSLVTLSAQIVFSQDMIRLAVPILTRLAEAVEMSAHLGVLDDAHVLYLLRRTPNAPLASNIRIGSRLPAHATTMGTIILAHMNEPDVETIFRGKTLSRFSDQTPTTMAKLHLALKRARQEGIAWSIGFFEAGIGSAAVPIMDFGGAPVAAINVSGPLDLFRDEIARNRIEQELRSAGAEISQRLGWLAP